MVAEAAPLLEFRHITKEFPGVRALDNVSLELRTGEIHALVGENGAGKSTLIKILAGIWPKGSYSGELKRSGRGVAFKDVRESREAGIAVIHQELALAGDMTVCENIFLGEEPMRGLWIDRQALLAQTQVLLGELEMDIEPDALIRDLGIGQRQMVEIAKAFAQNFRILVLDEPTAALSAKETEHLLKFLSKIKRRDIGILYISHRLKEVMELADRVTILRDAKHVASGPACEWTEDKLVSTMVGRQVDRIFPPVVSKRGKGVLRLEGVELDGFGPVGQPIHFELHEGEVLGLAGLVGSGRTELLEYVFGFESNAKKGHLFLDGKRRRIRSPRQAIDSGIALVSEDRKDSGLIPGESIQTNVTLAHLKAFSACGWIDRAKETAAAGAICSELRLGTRDLRFRTELLSGGNQQKVVMAKWLLVKPRVLLLDEPTRGIDIGAKSEIYTWIRRLADEGMAILLVSSELIEVIGLSDRILALSGGRLTGEFTRGQADQEKLMHRMTCAFK